MRQKRKEEHLQMALSTQMGPKLSGFDDLVFIHQAMSNLNLNQIDTTAFFLGQKLDAPLLIEAITGGTPRGMMINKLLAQGAARANIAMAVGSQTVAIDDPLIRETFGVVREYNPHGVILANVAANVPVESALAAVEMIKADGLQLHLNTVQELVMEEGDRCFSHTGNSIKEIIQHCPVPVIIKEVGFGISRETAYNLYGLGVEYLDVGGAGGTNFANIENQRRKQPLNPAWLQWGIPTVASLLECKSSKLPLRLIASGGIDDGIKVGKAIALGAQLAGSATPFLKTVEQETSPEKLVEKINDWILELKMTMLLTGAKNLSQLAYQPIIIKGETREWAQSRGINT